MSSKIRVDIIVFPGSNREFDVFDALYHVGGIEARLVNYREVSKLDADLIVLPGGFSWGDYLRGGAIAARTEVINAAYEAFQQGSYILGICNGFQILTEAALLPGALIPHGRFICKHVNLKAENSSSVYTSGYSSNEIISIPIAHQEGCFEADEATLEQLEANNRVAFRYVDQSGEATKTANPNGSMNNIAGILDESGKILGMMPHFENACLPHQQSNDGMKLFATICANVSRGGNIVGSTS